MLYNVIMLSNEYMNIYITYINYYCVCICMHACVCIYLRIHTHTYTHTQSRSFVIIIFQVFHRKLFGKRQKENLEIAFLGQPNVQKLFSQNDIQNHQNNIGLRAKNMIIYI